MRQKEYENVIAKDTTDRSILKMLFDAKFGKHDAFVAGVVPSISTDAEIPSEELRARFGIFAMRAEEAYPLAFRTILDAMTIRKFPFHPAGLVHKTSEATMTGEMTYNRLIRATTELTSVTENDTRFDILFKTTFAQHGREVAWAENMFSKRKPVKKDKKTKPEEPDLTDYNEIGKVDLRMLDGWRYARNYGDFNPIHLLGPSSAPIAHGQMVVERTMAAVRAQRDFTTAAAEEVKVSYMSKMPLGSEVIVHANWDARLLRITSNDNAQLHAEIHI